MNRPHRGFKGLKKTTAENKRHAKTNKPKNQTNFKIDIGI